MIRIIIFQTVENSPIYIFRPSDDNNHMKKYDNMAILRLGLHQTPDNLRITN